MKSRLPSLAKEAGSLRKGRRAAALQEDILFMLRFRFLIEDCILLVQSYNTLEYTPREYARRHHGARGMLLQT